MTSVRLAHELKGVDIESSVNSSTSNNVGAQQPQQRAQTQYLSQSVTPIGGAMMEERKDPELISGLKRAHYPLSIHRFGWRQIIGGPFFTELIAVALFTMISYMVIRNAGGDKLLSSLMVGGTLAALLYAFQEAGGVHMFFVISFIETLGQAFNLKMAVAFIAYLVAQLGGAAGGAAIALGFSGTVDIPTNGVGWTNWFVFMAEAFGALFIGFAYFLTPAYKTKSEAVHGHTIRPLMIGLAYAASFAAFSHISGGGAVFSGSSFTFVRWFGAALVMAFPAVTSNAWIYITGPIAGFLIAWIISYSLTRWVFRVGHEESEEGETPGGPVGEKYD